MAEIINVTGVTEREVSVQKGIGALALYTTTKMDDISNEMISLQIERNGKSNIEITQGFVSLKSLLLACTYGSDAIGAMKPNFETVAVIELAEMGAIELGAQDKFKIGLKGLDPDQTYILDGHEEPITSHEIFMYEEKIVPIDQANYDVNVEHYDILVINDDPNITELNFTHDNHVVTKHTLRELRAMSQDNDPVAYVQLDGRVQSSYNGFLQIPVKGMLSINVRKATGSIVKFFMRKDVDLVALGKI